MNQDPLIHEIRMFPLGPDMDSAASAVSHQARLLLGETVDVRTADVFYVEGVTTEEAERLAATLWSSPLTHQTAVEPRADWQNPNRVEIRYKNGVLNPDGAAILHAAGSLGIRPTAVDSGREHIFPAGTPEDVREAVISRILVNETVQEVRAKAPETLVTGGEAAPVRTIRLRGVPPEELAEMSKKESLHLNGDEMKVMQGHAEEIGRDLTDVEVQFLAARWSEHCCHKTFGAKLTVNGQAKDPLFKRIKDTARAQPAYERDVVSAFHDNAGVITFFGGYVIAGKVETHNSPSAIEPYGGAMTGTGGVLRDIAGTGRGFKNILSTDMFCFGELDLPSRVTKDAVLLAPPGAHDARYLQQRVGDGVRDYGNPMGVPTANGSIHYHPDFRAKPSVIVGAYGIAPEEYAQKGHPEIGDFVVTVGGRTGRDGIHGATFSSGAMTAETATINGSSVQIGDPIQEQKMFRALLEARDLGLVRAITDCGAAGFGSAIGEMAEGIGVDFDLARAPLKYAGLAPWEILMSESQERMVLAVDPNKLEELQAVCAKWNVEAAALGIFDGNQRFTARYKGDVVADFDYEFLTNGLPQREMVANWVKPQFAERQVTVTDYVEAITKVLGHGDVCSKQPLVDQYDKSVQGITVQMPYGGKHRDAPSDAVVQTPILGKKYAFVQAHGMNPKLNTIDPYNGSVWAAAEALSNYVAAGGDPRQKVALINNYITAVPNEQTLGALDMMVDAVNDFQRATDIPVVSGKDSLSGTLKGQDGEQDLHIPPTLTISVMGGVEDVGKTMTTHIKRAGSTLVLVGKPDYSGMGGSVLHDIYDGESRQVPQVDLEQLPKTLDAVHDAIRSGKVRAAHDISEGGLSTAVAEMLFGSDYGAILDLDDREVDLTRQLFNETAGCFVIEVDSPQEAAELFGNVPHRVIGRTTGYGNDFVIRNNGAFLTSVPVDELKAAWKQPMQEMYA